MQDTSVVEKFQSAYKAHHSTETALLRVFNDILFSSDQGKGEILVQLGLSSAFDTIDHAVLFDLWHDTFGISGTALSLLKSYLQDRTQCVQIDGIKSVRPEVRGTTDFDGGAYPPPKTSLSYGLTTLIIFRFGRAGRDR